MIHTGQIDRAWEQGPVTIRPLRSLTQQAVGTVSDAVAGVPGRWTVEGHDDYDGYLFVLISPDDEADAPSFLISGQVGRIELAKFHGDELATLGRFEDLEPTIDELVRALRQSLPQ